jgi:hypothetical protein
MFNHNFNQHSHDPFPPPKSTPFNHHNFTYNNTTTSLTPNWGWDKPFPHQQPFTTCIDQHLQHRPDPLSLTTDFAPLNSDPSQKGNNEIVQPHELVVDGDNFFPSFDSNSQVTADEKKLVNNVDVDIVTEPTHFDVVGESIFTVSKTDERSRDGVVAVKGQEENNRQVPSSISQSPCDSDRVESLIIQSIVKVPIGLVPAKHRSITTTRPSLLPYRFTFMTRNDDRTLFGKTKPQVQNHELSVNNFECSFDFPVVCTFNFDPGGDKSSPAANYGGNRSIFYLLWLPWDRGKFGACSFLPPASNLSHIYNTHSLLWKPLDRGKMSRKWMEKFLVPATPSCLFSEIWYFGNLVFANITGAATHVKEEEAIRVNGELKSVKFSNDLMGNSYLAQSSLSYLAHAPQKNCIFGKYT